jgi:hypothetical protein
VLKTTKRGSVEKLVEEMIALEVSSTRIIWMMKIVYHNLNQISDISRDKLDKRKDWTEKLMKQLELAISNKAQKLLYVIRLISHSYHNSLLSPDIFFQMLNNMFSKSKSSWEAAVLIGIIGEYIVDISNQSHDRLRLIISSLFDSQFTRKFLKVCCFIFSYFCCFRRSLLLCISFKPFFFVSIYKMIDI